MIEKSVVSCPPCWAAVEVNAAAALPTSASVYQAAGLIEERGHLARHAAEAGRGADHQAVVLGQRIDAGNQLVAVVFDETGGLGDFRRGSFRDAAHIAFVAGAPHAFGDGLSHLRDMAVGGVIEHEDAGHVGSFLLARWE